MTLELLKSSRLSFYLHKFARNYARARAAFGSGLITRHTCALLYPVFGDKDQVEPCENRRGRGRTVTFVRSIDRSRPLRRRCRRRRFHLARNALSRTSSSSPREWNQVSGTQTIFKQIGFHRTPRHTLFQTLPQTNTHTHTHTRIRDGSRAA